MKVESVDSRRMTTNPKLWRPVCVAILLAFLLPLFWSGSGMAQGTATDGVLRVGIYGEEPFVNRLPNGTHRGAAIELWGQIAELAGLTSRTAGYDSYADLYAALASGEIDVAVGNLAVIAAVEKRIDYLTPFHQSHLGIATRTRSESSILDALGSLLSRGSLQIVIGVILVVAVLTFLIWRFERRENPEIFGEHGRDFVSGAVWTTIIATAIEGDLFKMRSRGARILGLLMVLVGVTVIASYIALISSTLTVTSLTPTVRNAEGLKTVISGVVDSREGAIYADRNGLDHSTYDQVRDALDALRAGDVDAVIADRSELRYWHQRRGDHEFALLPDTLVSDRLAFAVAEGSNLREPLNRALLQVIESGTWKEILEQYGIR